MAKGVPHKGLVTDAGSILAIEGGTTNKFAHKMENRLARQRELLRRVLLSGDLNDVLSDDFESVLEIGRFHERWACAFWVFLWHVYLFSFSEISILKTEDSPILWTSCHYSERADVITEAAAVANVQALALKNETEENIENLNLGLRR